MTKKFNPYKLQVNDEQNVIAGLESKSCGCACPYVSSGGSSTQDNAVANLYGWIPDTRPPEIIIPL